MNAAGRRRHRRAVVALAVTVALGVLVGAAVAHIQSGRASTRSAAGHDAHDLERFDIVGEDHPGPVRVTLGSAAFPNRTLFLTMPRRNALPSSAVHVYEDGQMVSGVAVTESGTTSNTSRYVLRYVSTAPTGDHEVELSVVVDGVGVRDVDYSSPSARPAITPAPPRSFWDSGGGLIAVALVAALLLALAVLALLVPRRRRGELRRRLGDYTTSVVQEAVELPDEPRPSQSPWLERLLGQMSWWPRFQRAVEIARFGRPPVELVTITAAVTVLAAILMGIAVGTPVGSLIALPVGPLILRAVVGQRLRRQRELFGEQLAGHIDELASAMRAGHGLAAALAVVAQSATEPSHREWTRVVTDERLGKPLEEAMHSMAERMNSHEIEQVALVASLHSRTGGNMAEVLERVAEGVRERAELRRELKALTAQARLSRWVVTLLPPALIAIFTLLDRAYMRPLFTTSGGIVMLGICAALLVIGSLIMRRLTEIKV